MNEPGMMTCWRWICVLGALSIPTPAAAHAGEVPVRRMSRDQQEDLARVFWIWGELPRGSPTLPASLAALQNCRVEVLTISPFQIPAQSSTRIFSLGILTESLGHEEQRQAEEIFDSQLALPSRATLTTLRDVEAMLKVETAQDLLGCDNVTCMTEIGGAIGADYLIRGNIGKLAGRLVASARVVDAATAVVLGQAVIQYEDPRCLTRALREVATRLVAP